MTDKSTAQKPVTAKVDLYNTTYGHNEDQVYREVRIETYGEDFGQTSWTTLEEFREIAQGLALTSESSALEVGCGAGGCALYLAEGLGCQVTGVDVNAEGVKSASAMAHARGLGERVTFERHDAAAQLRFSDAAFDAVYSNDAMCHIPDRASVLREFHRVLKSGGRVLFSDALVITGAVSNQELAARSSIGYFGFFPLGENERMIEKAGFKVLRATDSTPNAAAISRKWHDARARRQNALLAIEGETNFHGLQKFLLCVHTLTSEKRLSRFVYLAEK